jgi:ribonuclease VapC
MPAARLNFGECFTYALAREKRELVLWKGVDFGHTDISPA